MNRPANIATVSRPKGFFVSALLDRMSHITEGGLLWRDGDYVEFFGSANATLQAEIVVTDRRFYKLLALGGSIAAGETYALGYWHSPNLTSVIQLMARNEKALSALDGLGSKLMSLVNRGWHVLRSNSMRGSKKNIGAHYDLGNAMYQSFLDPEMMYSSAIYPTADSTLAEAQLYRLQLICERLELQPGETLLEIGTGWGALAIYAAKHFGVRVTTTTISDEQYEYAKARIAHEGLEEQITLLKKDYRELEGTYDKLVSIEMIEAVGAAYYATYFDVLNKRLASNGKMLIQAITIADQRYDSYRKNVDFIQRYIFPGGLLPSVSVLADNIAKRTDMVCTALHDFGPHYGKTLGDWATAFSANSKMLAAIGYDEQFQRLWQYYFNYCQGGFRERSISVVHFVAAKPDWRHSYAIE